MYHRTLGQASIALQGTKEVSTKAHDRKQVTVTIQMARNCFLSIGWGASKRGCLEAEEVNFSGRDLQHWEYAVRLPP